jgi:hypothetical protein
LLAGCSSLSDFDRLHPVLVTDDIHVWVGAGSGGAGRREASLQYMADLSPADRLNVLVRVRREQLDRRLASLADPALRGLSFCS